MSVVLLIDDEPEMGALVDMCLDDPQVEVIQVQTGAAALNALRRGPPRLILLDIALGEEDGLSLLPRLRAEPGVSGVPVLAFSVHDSRREEALGKGADGFVAKPFRTETLRAALRAHLR